MNSLMTLLTSFDGRIGRGKFWLGAVLIILATLVIGGLLMALGLGEVTRQSGIVQINGGPANAFEKTRLTLMPWPSFILSVVMAIPAGAIGVKRRKDRDFSGVDVMGFLVLSLFVQLLALLGLRGGFIVALDIVVLVWAACLLIYLGFLKGTAGPNQYGPDPLAAPPSASSAAPEVS